MEKKQFEEKFDKLLITAKKDLYQSLNKLYDNKSINLENYDNDYYLPKIVLSAILKNLSNEYAPLSKDGKKESERLNNIL